MKALRPPLQETQLASDTVVDATAQLAVTQAISLNPDILHTDGRHGGNSGRHRQELWRGHVGRRRLHLRQG